MGDNIYLYQPAHRKIIYDDDEKEFTKKTKSRKRKGVYYLCEKSKPDPFLIDRMVYSPLDEVARECGLGHLIDENNKRIRDKVEKEREEMMNSEKFINARNKVLKNDLESTINYYKSLNKTDEEIRKIIENTVKKINKTKQYIKKPRVLLTDEEKIMRNRANAKRHYEMNKQKILTDEKRIMRNRANAKRHYEMNKQKILEQRKTDEERVQAYLNKLEVIKERKTMTPEERKQDIKKRNALAVKKYEMNMSEEKKELRRQKDKIRHQRLREEKKKQQQQQQ
jgi:hypothetical protein